jgi:Ni,Fe-hydrogenase maturation factor
VILQRAVRTLVIGYGNPSRRDDGVGSGSHYLKSEALLALAGHLYGHAPEGELFSIRGFDFDFGDVLRPETSAGARQVVVELWSAIERAQNDACH